jgi:hypothetical protein
MAQDHESWVVDMFSGMGAGQQDELMNDLMALKQSVKAAGRSS